MTDMEAFEAAGELDEEDEPCEICGSCRQTKRKPLLECSGCLRGFHTTCLTPPLKSVPEVRAPACFTAGQQGLLHTPTVVQHGFAASCAQCMHRVSVQYC